MKLIPIESEGVMKKCYGILLLVALPLLSATVMAQPPALPSLGIYFDQEGTQITGTFNGGNDETYKAYVICFFEAFVGGASYSVEIDPRLTLVNVEYPLPGIQIGSPTDGCGVEVGLTDFQFGYYHTPVVFSILTLFSGDQIIYDGLICVRPHCHYDAVIVADSEAQLYAACAGCGFLTVPVGTETDTWGMVKHLYE
jgi:hypothetical protein